YLQDPRREERRLTDLEVLIKLLFAAGVRGEQGIVPSDDDYSPQALKALNNRLPQRYRETVIRIVLDYFQCQLRLGAIQREVSANPQLRRAFGYALRVTGKI
ncbi:MAG: hypothetical protein PHS44_07030, partial [Candidatus Dojkabacteria bacterium]|nr:hypothetical protein [Candidatus Dojkabacteria bacterium]